MHQQATRISEKKVSTLRRDLTASMDTGSAVPSMTAGIINKLLVARPADVFLEKFENQMRTLFVGMSLSEREIANLTSLRDFLLPVLMNGQVKITAA